MSALTVNFEVHSPEDKRSDKLGLHLSFEVDEDGGHVAVRVVGDAGRGDGLEELGLRELPGQCGQVLVDQGAQRNTREGQTWTLSIFVKESLIL